MAFSLTENSLVKSLMLPIVCTYAQAVWSGMNALNKVTLQKNSIHSAIQTRQRYLFQEAAKDSNPILQQEACHDILL